MAYLFLKIFTTVEIEKTVENHKPRSRFIGKHLKIGFTVISLSFMPLFSHSPQIISGL